MPSAPSTLSTPSAPSARRRSGRRSRRLAATFVLALLLPLVVPLVAPVSVAGADNGNGGDDVGLCVTTLFLPVGDLDTDPLDLDTDPEAFPTLSLPAGVGHLMFIVASDSLESECPVFDPDGGPTDMSAMFDGAGGFSAFGEIGGLEDDDFVPFDAFQAFLPGVSLPTDADDEIIPFVAEVDLLGPTFDPDSGVIPFEPIPWASLWTEDGAPAVDGPETDLKLLNEGTTLEGPMELIVPPDENGGSGSVPVTAALFVPFIVSSELAWEDLGLDVRLFGLDLDDQREPEPFADWTVEDLTVRGDLCLIALLSTGFDPDDPARLGDDVVFGAAKALAPGDDVLMQYGVIRDDGASPGESACDLLSDSLDGEEPEMVLRKVAAEHVPPTLDFGILSFLLLSRPGDDGEEEAPWIELMAKLDVVEYDPDDDRVFVIDGLDGPTDTDGALDGELDDDDGPPTFLTIGTEPDTPGLWETTLLFTVQEDAAPGEYFIDLFLLAFPAFEDGRGFGPGGGLPFAFVLAGNGFVEEGLEDGFFAGAESDPMRLTIEVLGDDDADGVTGEGGGSGGDGGGSGEVVEGGGEGDVEGSVTCSAPVAGAGVSCTLTSVPERTFTWEASTNPVFASGEVTTDASGSAVFTFPIPAALLGEAILVNVLGVAGSGGPIGTVAAAPAASADGPVPTSVPAGEGPVATHGHVGLLGAVALMGALLGVVVLLSPAPAAPLRLRRATRSGGCPAS